jgi:hypothetical protein
MSTGTLLLKVLALCHDLVRIRVLDIRHVRAFLVVSNVKISLVRA